MDRYLRKKVLEIMLVITIIITLIAIMLFYYARAVDQTRFFTSKTYIHFLRTGLELYRAENGSYPDGGFDGEQFYQLMNSFVKIKNPFPQIIEWVDYWGGEEDYTLMVRAIDRRRTLLTSSRRGIQP